jgi:hypothetical protein
MAGAAAFRATRVERSTAALLALAADFPVLILRLPGIRADLVQHGPTGFPGHRDTHDLLRDTRTRAIARAIIPVIARPMAGTGEGAFGMMTGSGGEILPVPLSTLFPIGSASVRLGAIRMPRSMGMIMATSGAMTWLRTPINL